MQGDQTKDTSFESSPVSIHPQEPVNGAATVDASPGATADLSKETQRLNLELSELKDKYVRVHAEMENIRRRQERERADLLKYAMETIFKDLLPVLDSLEKALPEGEAAPEGSSNSASYFDGMMMVKKQLLEVCRKHGLEAIEAQNAPFDPTLHQAIQRLESSDVEVDTVASEFARGYQLHGRLLRPSMVSVRTPAGS